MAELAAGAVRSLLGVLQNEARLLGRVEGDVQFIREEMESMSSFLLHLARTVPPGGKHDEQVRTWMNQVRLLAQDCNNFIDLYVYRENPDLHLGRKGLRRCLLWVPWFLKKMVAQHCAAGELAKLKERARDVGERRVRYGVDIPSSSSSSSSSKVVGQSPSGTAGLPATFAAGGQQAAQQEGDDDDGVDDQAEDAVMATGHRALLRLAAGDPEDYFNGKLANWMEEVEKQGKTEEIDIPVITTVAPNDTSGAVALAKGAQALAAKMTHFRSVLVDLSEVHYTSDPLLPEDFLYYMWRELELEEHAKAKPKPKEEEQGEAGEGHEQARRYWHGRRKWFIYREKKAAIHQIIEDTNVGEKIKEIKKEIEKVNVDDLNLDLRDVKMVKRDMSTKSLSALLLQLKSVATVVLEQDNARWKTIEPTLAVYWEDIIKETASKLRTSIHVQSQEGYYEGILQEVFLLQALQEQEQPPAAGTMTTTSTATATPEEHRIQAMIQKAKEEILQELVQKLLQDKYDDKKQATGDPPAGCQGQIAEAQTTATAETNSEIKKTQGQAIPPSHIELIEETKKKLDKIQQKIQEPLKIEGIMDKIRHYLKGKRALVIFNVQKTECETAWEGIRNALSQLGCVAGAVTITTSEKYCHSSWEPMEYSLVGIYHDTMLQIRRERMNIEEDESPIDPKIFREILNECHNNELCMKIFAHALYANHKRSSEELRKLLKTLQHAQKAPSESFGSIAKKMFKFAYSDLPKEYKTCLLYLAIFPRGHKIRRSTLIGRWVAEGLITTEDWSWENSVCEAERCFIALINRLLVYPEDIGPTGKVQSCRVGDLVHEFITKLAKKQRIVETRLSHHLARHFSISNDLHLRGSDRIEKFFTKISESSKFSVLKVLDLEGCLCFNGKNKRYLKEICRKILLLKYLSLRRTDLTKLPNEINNLHELEVLDIRQTKLHANSTRHVQLLKLKRLLAGHIGPSPSSVLVPEKIKNMLSMEVLSNVKPQSTGDLDDIGNLWHLRKLGVVIENDNHLSKLVNAISNLHDCLRSLLITLPIIRSEDTPRGNLQQQLPDDIFSNLQYTLDNLESLSISGITQKGQLLPLLTTKGINLTKVTLSSTWLNQEDLKVLGQLTKLHYLKLRHKAYNDKELTFKEDEFKYLKCFLVEGSNMTCIIFNVGATPELEKMFLPFTGDLKLSGVENLTKLGELELKNSNITTTTTSSSNTTTNNSGNTTTTATSNNSATNSCGNTSAAATTNVNDGTLLSTFCNAKQLTKVTLSGTLLKKGDLQNLAKNPNICCLTLLDNSYVENELTFNNNAEFPKLNVLIVNCPSITKISFTHKCTTKINKIVWSFTRMESLSDLDNLLKLRELEFNGELVPTVVKNAIKKHKNKPYFLHNKPERLDQEAGRSPEEDKDNT